jgi:hypothetical protein
MDLDRLFKASVVEIEEWLEFADPSQIFDLAMQAVEWGEVQETPTEQHEIDLERFFNKVALLWDCLGDSKLGG